jgi:hypothetical protein
VLGLSSMKLKISELTIGNWELPMMFQINAYIYKIFENGRFIKEMQNMYKDDKIGADLAKSIHKPCCFSFK